MNKLSLVCLFLLFTFFSLESQNLSLRFNHVDISNGMSLPSLSGIDQDKYGFIWFGTQDGLFKYDGYDFKKFTHDQLDPYSLSDSYVLSLLIDSHDQLWIGTESGLNQYDFISEKFIKYSDKLKHSSDLEYTRNINEIIESRFNQDLLWLGTNYGISSFNTVTNEFANYPLPSYDSIGKRHISVATMYESVNELGILWLGTNNGLYRFDTESCLFEHYMREEGLSKNSINCILLDSYKNIWIGTDKDLNSYNIETHAFNRYNYNPQYPTSIGNSYINTIFEDSNKNLWIGTEGGGLNLFNKETNSFSRWENQPGNSISISGNSVLKIFEDKSGLLWICTSVNGINLVNPNFKNIDYYYKDLSNSNSLIGNRIRTIMVDNTNKMWVGTQNGISIINRKTGEYKHLTYEPNHSNSLSANQTRVLFQDRSGIIWIGTRNAGVDRYDPITNTFRNFRKDPDNPNSIGGNSIRAIHEDEDGIFWIGSVYGGLNRFDPKTEEFKHYYYEENNPNSINDNRVYAIIGGNDGVLWIGTGSGVAKFNIAEESFTRYLAKPDDPNSLSHHLVMGVTKDNAGNIWISTYGGGLNKLNPITGKVKRYTENEGMPNNVIYGAIEDNEFNIWVSTNQGIAKLNPFNEQITTYGYEDGLQNNEFNAGAYFKSKDGEIFFGGINGLNSFYPNKIIKSTYIPPIEVCDFQLFNKSITPSDSVSGKSLLLKSIIETDTITLSYEQNVFSFSFTALDFSFPEQNRYEYILENFESEWNNVGSRRFATYTNLPAGEYVFHVTGSSSSGIWNKEGRSITVIVIPPWWKTKVFYIVSFLGVILLIVLYNRLRIRNLKADKIKLENRVNERTVEISKKNAILEDNQFKLETQRLEIQNHVIALKEANATKDRFFSIMAHDLRNPFNVILGYADILYNDYFDYNDIERKRMLKEIDQASRLTYDLLENILTWSRSQRGIINIKKELLNLKIFVNESIGAYIHTAKKKNITIKVDVDEDIEVVVDRFTFSTILVNLISNAIKFTPEGGKVIISADNRPYEVSLSIQDNGVGIGNENIDKLFSIDQGFSTIGTNNEKGTGLGLILCKEFIDKNDGRIEVESEINKGTTIHTYLPKSH